MERAPGFSVSHVPKKAPELDNADLPNESNNVQDRIRGSVPHFASTLLARGSEPGFHQLGGALVKSPEGARTRKNVYFTMACTMVSSLIVGCAGDMIARPDDISLVDGKAQGIAMARFRANAEGCSFSIETSSGSAEMIALHGSDLPFEIPAVRNPITHRGNGRVVSSRVKASGSGNAMTINCLVPNDMSYMEFANKVFSASKSGSLEYIYSVLRRTPLEPVPVLSRSNPLEWQELQREFLSSVDTPMPFSRTGGALRELVCEIGGMTSPAPLGSRASFSIGDGCTCLISSQGGVVTAVVCTEDDTGGTYFDSFGFYNTGNWDGDVACGTSGCGGNADGSIQDPGGDEDDACPSCTYITPSDSDKAKFKAEGDRLQQSLDPQCKTLGQTISSMLGAVRWVDTPWQGANGTWVGGEYDPNDSNGMIHISRYTHDNVPPDYKELAPWDGAKGINYELRHEYAHMVFGFPQGRLFDEAEAVANKCA
jgi:hypothetical protein